MTNEKDKNDIDIKVLAERIDRNREILELRLSTIRNYATIIIAILTIIGVASVWTLIKTIVSQTAESTLEKILTDDYVEEKVRTRSERAINKLISEAEKRAVKVVEKYSTYQDWEVRSREAIIEGRIQDAKQFYGKTAKKAKFTDNADQNEYQALLGKAEAELILGEYSNSLDTLRKAQPLSGGAFYNQSMILVLKTIAYKLMKSDNMITIDEFTQLLKDASTKRIHWDFRPLQSYVSKSEISPDDVDYIQKIINIVNENRANSYKKTSN